MTIDERSEYLTTYDQIIDAASLLTYKIEYHRNRWRDSGKANEWVKLYNRALCRYIELMSTIEIRINEIKGFRKFFIYPDKQKDIPYYNLYIRRKTIGSHKFEIANDRDCDTNNQISFEYYDSSLIHSDRFECRPTLYDILDYIKSTFYIFSTEQGLFHLQGSIDDI